MYDMHLIINTHWDREYRWSFSETQFRLVEAVDDLIDIMRKDQRFAYFHTDSQVSMLDDYLEIRPERREELKALVREGRILTGPWYTLPAEFLVSGEALVRNLLMGHRIAKGLGKVMKAAYNIFSWGQISQLPQIYRQFGMDTIIFYRGIDQSSLSSLEFKWKAPDGTEALGITFGAYHRLNFWRYVYLPYILGDSSVSGDNHTVSRENLGSDGFLVNLCDADSDDINHQVINQGCARDIKGALKGLDRLVATVSGKTSVSDLLFLQGFDQENPDPVVPDLVDEINQNISFGKIKVDNLPDYIQKVKTVMTQEKIIDRLPVREGEMLETEKVGDAFGPLYNGVFSARMPVKLKNAECQYLMEKWAEPAAVFDMAAGQTYPELQLRNAWKELLKNQQHDGIGGCHVDRVTKTMNERYENVRDIAHTVIRNALKDLTCHIDFSGVGADEIGLSVFNSSQYVRNEIMIVTFDVPKSWHFRYNGRTRRDFSLHIFDCRGREVRSQILSFEDDTVYGYLKFGNVIDYDVTHCVVAFEAGNIPPMGYQSFKAVPDHKIQRPVDPLSKEVNVLENEFIRAEINPNGSIRMLDKKTGKQYDGLNYFEDAADKGGPLKFDMPYEAGIETTLTQSPDIAMISNGPLYAKYRITYRWALPESIGTRLKIHVPHGSEWVDQGRLQRSEKRKVLEIKTDVVLKSGSRRLEFATTIDNTITDHRLRAVFPTGLAKAAYAEADSPYDVVKRAIAVPDATGWYEEAARTWPSQSFVSVNDGKAKISLLHRGIPEYEVTDNDSRSICLTLLRCFGTAGNPTETYRYQELAQCLGKHEFHYAVFADSPSAPADATLAESIVFNNPLHAVQTTGHRGTFKPEASFFKVSSPKFVVTALKKAEDSKGIILRGYNVSDDTVDVTVQCCKTVRSAKKVTLEEKEIGALTIRNDEIHGLSVCPKEIASILIEI